MKYRIFGFCLILVLAGWPTAHAASYEGYRQSEKTENSFQVFGRGVGNAVGMPLEITSTMVREYRMHSRLWPVTMWPRALSNIFIRSASTVNDLLFLPWTAPVTDQTSPWTEDMGLPSYPWNVD